MGSLRARDRLLLGVLLPVWLVCFALFVGERWSGRPTRPTLLVTSGGKKIAPAPIEALLKRHPLVAEAMVVGEARKFPAVLIVPDFAALEHRLDVLGRPRGSREELVTRTDVLSLYNEVIEPLNRDLAQFERLKKVALLPAEFSIATGELTPTLKLRRRVVLERWQAVVDRLYADP